jgi:hypothetical protein
MARSAGLVSCAARRRSMTLKWGAESARSPASNQRRRCGAPPCTPREVEAHEFADAMMLQDGCQALIQQILQAKMVCAYQEAAARPAPPAVPGCRQLPLHPC